LWKSVWYAGGVIARWTSSRPFDAQRVGAVAIYCSDGRYNEQFDEFLHTQLGLPRYDRLTLPGGPGALAGHFMAYRDEEALVDQLGFLIEAHKLERVVLIAHAGCGFYLKKLGIAERAMRARQEEDLGKAAARIAGISSRVRAESYFASPGESGVVIERVGM
jgi:hypothetical protein